MTSNCVLTVTCVRSNHNPMNIIVTFAFHSTTVTLVPPHNTKLQISPKFYGYSSISTSPPNLSTDNR